MGACKCAQGNARKMRFLQPIVQCLAVPQGTLQLVGESFGSTQLYQLKLGVCDQVLPLFVAPSYRFYRGLHL